MNQQTCERYRNGFDLRDDAADFARDAHIATCPACQLRLQRSKAFDDVVQTTIMRDVPDDLTARLLALVPGLVVTPALVRTQRWKRQRRAVVWAGSFVSVAVIVGLVYGVYLLGMSLGLGNVLADIGTLTGQFFDWLYRTVPSSRQVVAFLLMMQRPVQWAILLMVMWQVWERMPQRSSQQMSA